VTTDARVLVVEDDDTLRETLAEVLLDEGYDVRVAGHGREALGVLTTWVPEVIVLDLMMPEMDAFEFRRHQRDHELAPEARVMILSAARDLEGAAENIRADAWLAKPFNLTEMLDAVDRLVGDSAA
jgi:CheY-like chemotaxis protein